MPDPYDVPVTVEVYQPRETCRVCGATLPAGHRRTGVCADCVAASHVPKVNIPPPGYGRVR